MEKAKVTFLMLAFNSERFIKDTIESILNQSETNIKLIIRNNASTDSTGEICQKYAEKDNRICYIENKKPYVTDEGIKNTQNGWWPKVDSEYISTIDHDDILEPDFVETLYKKAKDTDADWVVCGAEFFDDKTGKIVGGRKTIDLITNNMKDLENNFFEIYNVLRTHWGKLYKTIFFENNYEESYKFPHNLKLSKDTYRNLFFLEKCKKIVSIDKQLYNYRISQGSQYNSDFVELYRITEGDILYERAIECVIKLRIDTVKNIEFLKDVHWGHMQDLIYLLSQSKTMSLEQRILFIQEIFKNKYVGNYCHEKFSITFGNVVACFNKIFDNSKVEKKELWQFYIIRLYEAYLYREENISMSFFYILSAVLDKENINNFGLTLLEDPIYSYSIGEKLFSKLNFEKKISLIKETREKLLLKLMYPYSIEELQITSNELIEAIEKEDYETAIDKLIVLEQKYPESEIAVYYRIYLLTLTEDYITAKKLAYCAKEFWKDNKVILELCEYVINY